MERHATVAAEAGLHARPATDLAAAAAAATVPVTIGRPDGPAVDAASALMVMSLGVQHGESVVLRAEGSGAEQALAAAAGVIERIDT